MGTDILAILVEEKAVAVVVTFIRCAAIVFVMSVSSAIHVTHVIVDIVVVPMTTTVTTTGLLNIHVMIVSKLIVVMSVGI
jgi:hypothetical protein